MPRQGKDDISVALPGVASGFGSHSASASTETLRAYRAGRDSPERERAREMFATHAKNRSALKSLRVRAATCVQQQEGGVEARGVHWQCYQIMPQIARRLWQ